jgi:hypothetical protein
MYNCRLFVRESSVFIYVFFLIALRMRQIIPQTVLDICQVDVLLGINSTRSVYRKTATAVLVKMLFCVLSQESCTHLPMDYGTGVEMCCMACLNTRRTELG